MAGSPFNKKSSTASADAPARSNDPADINPTNIGDDKPVSGGDPFDVSDPSGISGYKPIAFMNQLVLMHPIETGRRVTSNSGNEEDGKSPFARVDIIPMTIPTSTGTPTKDKMVLTDDGEFMVLNKDGDPETFEAYAVGDRIDDLMFFNKPLVAEAEKALRKGNNWIIGRISRGEAKPNQSPPIILVTASDEDKEIYAAWRKEAMAARKG